MQPKAPLHDLNEYLRLSAVLSYQISAASVGARNVLAIIKGGRTLPDPERDEEVLAGVLDWLVRAYGDRRRRVGAMAVLHPIRATALLARALDELNLLDLLTALLHDKIEDITGPDAPPDPRGPGFVGEIEREFASLIKRIDPGSEWYLMERLDTLTRTKHDTYFRYTGALLDRARRTPEIARVKLADCLDNTLDMRIDLQDPLEGSDFFQAAFRVLFTGRGGVPGSSTPHPPAGPIKGANRLYQLFKDSAVLSLARQKGSTSCDPAAATLFEAIAVAGMKEAERIALHLLTWHIREAATQRELLAEAMRYCREGGADAVFARDEKQRLDGLFTERFDHANAETRARCLGELYADKALMFEAAVAFIVVFMSFLDDPAFYVRGIDPDGIHPQRRDTGC